MRTLLKNILPYGLVAAVQKRRHAARHASELERIQRHRNETIAEYFKSHPVRKLQIGCRHRTIAGWLNADLIPREEGVIFMDATQRFPFDDNTLDYIFTEHMIEHISYQDGRKMLAECFRVLKPSGKIRTATPNLAAIINLYTPQKNETQSRYITFTVDRCLPDIGIYRDCFVINNFFRNFGHQFIYDPPTLAESLRNAGFINIVERNVGESDDEHLRGIEQHWQDITDEFNRLETFVLEATKPK